MQAAPRRLSPTKGMAAMHASHLATTHNAPSQSMRLMRFGRIAAAIALLLSALFATSVLPQQAHALQVESCTAAPNEDGGNRILGATDTRVTWRAHSDENESIKSITLSLPESVSIDPAQAKVTGLNDLERIELNATVSSPTNGTIVIDMPEAAPAGLSFLVEMYGVTFPGEGGTFNVVAQTTAADGTVADLGPSEQTIEVSGVSAAEQLSAWLGEQAWVDAWNSNKFLHLFFDPTLIVTSIPQVFNGWLAALGIVVIAFPAAIPVGFILALMRMAKFSVLRGIASVYVNVVRGTPMFLQIYIAFFGLPLLGLNVNNFALGCCVMALNSSAYLCEIFRAGIQSISKGQFEAARSLGMNGRQTMLHVIAPQAFRRVIPTMTNELILLYKDTSLLAAVGIMETVMYAKTITAATGNITPYIVAAMFYLIVTLPMSRITRGMEERTGGRKVAIKKKPADEHPKSVTKKQKGWEPDLNAAKDELAIKTADL